MANEKQLTAFSGLTNPKVVFGTATMVAGTLTITAAEYGLNSIIHCFVFPWGITTVTGWIPGSTTAFSATGNTSVVLELIEDDGTALDGTNVCSVMLVGN